MGQVIQAEHIFLRSREEHIHAMETESRLRDLAAKAASFFHSGLSNLSNQIILDVVPEERTSFRQYLEEYLKYYEPE